MSFDLNKTKHVAIKHGHNIVTDFVGAFHGCRQSIAINPSIEGLTFLCNNKYTNVQNELNSWRAADEDLKAQGNTGLDAAVVFYDYYEMQDMQFLIDGVKAHNPNTQTIVIADLTEMMKQDNGIVEGLDPGLSALLEDFSADYFIARDQKRLSFTFSSFDDAETLRRSRLQAAFASAAFTLKNKIDHAVCFAQRAPYIRAVLQLPTRNGATNEQGLKFHMETNAIYEEKLPCFMQSLQV